MAEERDPFPTEKAVTTETMVADLSVGNLVGILKAVLEERRQGGDPRLLDLTVKEFTENMIAYTSGRAYKTAVAENNVAERVLSDWQGLKQVQAVMQPFRIQTAADVQKLGNDLIAVYSRGAKTTFVVAIAIVEENGTYSPNGLGLGG